MLMFLAAAPVAFFPQTSGGAPQTPELVGPSFRFADFDADGLADVYVVRPASGDQLYKNLGDGTFVDVTAERGLAGVTGTRMALWQDFDGDARLDLYLSPGRGAGRLLRQGEQGVFADVSELSGLARGRESELFAEWLDFDGDGRADLHIVTRAGDRMHRNVGGGRFELVALPQLGEFEGEVVALSLPQSLAQGGNLASGASGTIDETRASGPLALGNRCPKELKDSATGNCVPMSSVPALGQLYPLSTNLNVDAVGNVGMGTATPGQRLDVAGNVRAMGQLMSSVGTGTAPLSVSSTTKVTNLNADTLDGVDSSVFSQLGGSIEGSEITDGSVDVVDLAGSSVTTGKLANSAVTSGKISDGTIASIDIAAGAITSPLIATSAVGSSQIAGGAVGTAHLELDAIDSSRVLDASIALADLAPNSVDGARILDGSVDTADIAGSSVTSGKIANGTIQAADIGNGQITNALLAANSVGNSHLQLGSVGLPNISTTGANAGQYLGFNGSGVQWLSAPTSTWTPIGSLPYVINQPGGYYLADNLTGVAGQNGITISVGGVVLNLAGFELGGVASSLSGVHVASIAREVRITGGTVRGWGGNGVNVSGVDVVLDDLRIRGNAGSGVYVNTGPALISGCMSQGNTIFGFDVAGTVIQSSLSAGNLQSGFYAFATSMLVDCRASNHLFEGFRAEASSSLSRCLASDNQSTGFVLDDGSSAADCTATGSTTGFLSSSGARLDRCVARACDFGIDIQSSLCTNSVADDCDVGIVATYSRIVDCHATFSQCGFVIGSSSRVSGCVARGSGTGSAFRLVGSGTRVSTCDASAVVTGFELLGVSNYLDGCNISWTSVCFGGTGTRNVVVNAAMSNFTTDFALPSLNTKAPVQSAVEGAAFGTANIVFNYDQR